MKTYYYVKQRAELFSAFHPIIHTEKKRERLKQQCLTLNWLSGNLPTSSHFTFLSAPQGHVIQVVGKILDFIHCRSFHLGHERLRDTERDDTQFCYSSRYVPGSKEGISGIPESLPTPPNHPPTPLPVPLKKKKKKVLH